MRHSRRLIALLIVIGMGLFGLIYAAETRQDTLCVVEADTVIEGNLYALCRDLTIRGRVRGSVIGAAFETQISGVVEENIYLLGGHLTFSGALGDDLHFAGISLELAEGAQLDVGSHVLSAGLTASQDADAAIPGDLIALGYQWMLDGEVGGAVDFWGSALHIGGMAGEVNATVGDARAVGIADQVNNLLFLLPFEVELVDPGLLLREEAQVIGDLRYQSPVPGKLDGVVGGEVAFTEIISPPTLEELVEEEDTRVPALEAYVRQSFREFAALIVAGGALLLAAPGTARGGVYALRQRPVSSLMFGSLTFIFSFPVLLLALIGSLIVLLALALLRLDSVVLVVGLALGVMNLGGASVFYFIAVYMGRAVVCIAMGRLFARRFTVGTGGRAWATSLVIGALLLALLAALPTIGWMINLLALLLGLGALLLTGQSTARALRDRGGPRYATPLADGRIAPLPAVPAPPRIDDPPPARGMDNLPEGFTWWKDE